MRPTITLLFIAILCFCMPAEGQQAQDRAIPEQEVAPKHIIIDSVIRGGIDEKEHAPMILLYRGLGTGIRDREPTLLFALWRDGTIIWCRTEDKNLDGRDIARVEHFQSKISEKHIEDFLQLAVDKVDFEILGRRDIALPRMFGAPSIHFFLKTENVQCHHTMDHVWWMDVHVGQWSQEAHQVIDAWRTMLDLLLGLIPEEGERISILIEEKPVERRWERRWMITPVPLREADRVGVSPNVRDNTSNWESPAGQ